MPKKVTLKFLAERLGLSKSAVSSVLNNAPLARSFAPETRERIYKAAEEYKYKPNYFARYLNHQRSYLIGVLSPDLAEGYNANVLGGIEDYLLQSDYRYFLATHEWSNTRIERTIQMFLERGVDGLILINTPLSSEVDLPLAVIGNADTVERGISIVIDNHAGIRLALEHLGAEREECVYVGDAPQDVEMARRAGVPAIGVLGPFPTTAGLRAAQPDLLLDSVRDLPRHLRGLP